MTAVERTGGVSFAERVAQVAVAAATQPTQSAPAHHCQPRCRYQAAKTGPNAWGRYSKLSEEVPHAAVTQP